jgi:hypothetical protein
MYMKVFLLMFAVVACLALIRVCGVESKSGSFSWSRSYGGGYDKASFRSIKGSASRSFKYDNESRIRFDFSAKCAEGRLSFAVLGPDKSETVIFSVNAGECSDSREMLIVPGKRYKIVLRGDNARSGSYDIRWAPIAAP